MGWKKSVALSLSIAFLAAACGGYTKSLVWTGEGLTATGEQYMAANKQIEDLKAKEKLSSDRIVAWNKFKAEFKRDWAEAHRLWQIADESGDLDTPAELLELFLKLKNELVNFLLNFYGMASLKGVPA